MSSRDKVLCRSSLFTVRPRLDISITRLDGSTKNAGTESSGSETWVQNTGPENAVPNSLCISGVEKRQKYSEHD